MRLGTTELIVILIVVVIIFGPSQIPKLMRIFGDSIKALREGVEGKEDKGKKDGSEAGTKVSAASSDKNESPGNKSS